MKKYTSAAGLAIRLTWLRVLVYIVFLGICQWISFLTVNNTASAALEFRLDDLPAWAGRLGNLGIMLMLYYALRGSKGSRMDYTLRRLSLSEMTVTAVWALVFSGWFLLYWVFQIGLMFGMYAQYVSDYGGGWNMLFVAAMRSDYFHYLLPLYEPWGFVRNIVMCLAFGSFTALGAQNARNGRWNPLCLAWLLMILWALLTPQEVAWQWQDITVSVCALVCVIWDWIWSWRWMRSEKS